MNCFPGWENVAATESLFGSNAYFGLSIDLGPVGDNARATAALNALWSHSEVEGVWSSEGDIGNSEKKLKEIDATKANYGLLKIGVGLPIMPFMVSLIREQYEKRVGLPENPQVIFSSSFADCSDWFTIDIPTNAFRKFWQVDESWTVETQPWMSDFIDAFCRLADVIYAAAPFGCGVIGEETSGCWRMPSPARLLECYQEWGPHAVLDARIIKERGGFFVSPLLWKELQPVSFGDVLSSGLIFVPPVLNARLCAETPWNTAVRHDSG